MNELLALVLTETLLWADPLQCRVDVVFAMRKQSEGTKMMKTWEGRDEGQHTSFSSMERSWYLGQDSFRPCAFPAALHSAR